jgi:hypothetical protein
MFKFPCPVQYPDTALQLYVYDMADVDLLPTTIFVVSIKMLLLDVHLL